MLSTTTTIPAPLRFPNPLGFFLGGGGEGSVRIDTYLAGWTLDLGPWILQMIGCFLFCFVLFCYTSVITSGLSVSVSVGGMEGGKVEGREERGKMGGGMGGWKGREGGG